MFTFKAIRQVAYRPSTLRLSLLTRPFMASTVRMSGRPEKSEFEQRAMDLLKGFDKVSPDTVRSIYINRN
jgi:hypothetical protein